MHYIVKTQQLNAHIFELELIFNINKHQDNYLYLANWTPGSYMIRDYCRHIISISACCNKSPQLLRQINKNSWKLPDMLGEWTITYQLYAYDLSVRGCYLDQYRGFFEGAAIFMTLKGYEELACTLEINLPEEWQIATGLTALDKRTFHAQNYAQLIDSPMEMGKFISLHFDVQHIPHQIIISGDFIEFDQQKLVEDVTKICRTHIAMFGSAPFKDYIFMLHVGDKIYGGLEHRNSTALLADRKCLPLHQQGNRQDYISLLGLFSHEYFHAWNVKSIKPSLFDHYDLQQEVYTEQLWAFEGITSYYDDLALYRCGCISLNEYLQLLADNITRVYSQQGRFKQSITESSFNAWTKFYKQDENAANAIVSYYQKGALAALCLDLYIRQHSAFSLDDVMKALYQDFLNNKLGIAEKQWQQKAQDICQLEMSDFFNQILYSREDLPLAPLLQSAGLLVRLINNKASIQVVEEFPIASNQLSFGAKLNKTSSGLAITQIHNNSHAEIAGLAVGDIIVAINNYHSDEFDRIWEGIAINQQVSLHYFHQGILKHGEFTTVDKQDLKAFFKVIDHDSCEQWLSGKS